MLMTYHSSSSIIFDVGISTDVLPPWVNLGHPVHWYRRHPVYRHNPLGLLGENQSQLYGLPDIEGPKVLQQPLLNLLLIFWG